MSLEELIVTLKMLDIKYKILYGFCIEISTDQNSFNSDSNLKNILESLLNKNNFAWIYSDIYNQNGKEYYEYTIRKNDSNNVNLIINGKKL
jgi:hypothetical protein